MAATPSKPSTEFVTTNLVLATFLVSEGYEPELLVLDREGVSQEHQQGAWRFHYGADPDSLAMSIAEFKDGEARVEPEAFQKQINQVRRELFDFLGIN